MKRKTHYTAHLSDIQSKQEQPIQNIHLPVLMNSFSDLELDRIAEMAWEDRTPFDAIKYQFGINESKVKQIMKQTLKRSSYIRWRKRVESCNTKHQAKRNPEINRFKCTLQRTISGNKISKRH